MEETVLTTFDDVKFIQGVTKMNQTNWQKYFGVALPNGIYSGLMMHDRIDSQISSLSVPQYLSDGIACANGLFAEISTENGWTDLDTAYGQGIHDRFICLRVWFSEAKAQIVQKSGIAEWSTTGTTWYDNTWETAGKFVSDESYCCTRNEYYWDIPLYYNSEETGTLVSPLACGIDLRRVVDVERKKQMNPILYNIYESNPDFALISGRNLYEEYGVNYNTRIYMDSINHPDGALLYQGNTGSQTTIEVYSVRWVNGLASYNNSLYVNNGASIVSFVFAQPELWTSSGRKYTYTKPAVGTAVIRFTLLGSSTFSDIVSYRYLVEVL